MDVSIKTTRWSPSASQLRWILNLWPPLLMTGIKVLSIADDFQFVKAKMSMRWYNRNYVGVHFGGSLYAMTDPFYMLMLMRNLGSAYYVWDESAEIKFVRPGKGNVYAEFLLNDNIISDIKSRASSGEKTIVSFDVDIKNKNGELVSRVIKNVYVRLKKHK